MARKFEIISDIFADAQRAPAPSVRPGKFLPSKSRGEPRQDASVQPCPSESPLRDQGSYDTVTRPDPNNPQAPDGPDSRVAPESLELRAQPGPVTRINRKVLIGAAAVLLFLNAGLVLLALRAP